MSKKDNEYERFDRTMRRLMAVTHDEIKAKLEAEKAEKRKRKLKKTSASGRALGEKG
jgi:hypothetical protein